jgi:hypothetical protein
MQTKINRLILVPVAVCAEGLEDLHEKKGLGRAAKELLELFGGRKSRRPPRARKVF